MPVAVFSFSLKKLMARLWKLDVCIGALRRLLLRRTP
jgi:hypothetical protein